MISAYSIMKNSYGFVQSNEGFFGAVYTIIPEFLVTFFTFGFVIDFLFFCFQADMESYL